MTLAELQAKRDEIFKTAGIASANAASGAGVVFSADKLRELAMLDAEIARQTGTTRIRQVRLYGSKGL
jgi:hypothetical protein